jgi:hypothetical protein
MTDRPRKTRASKRQLRATALIAGGVAFAAPFTALAVAPKSDTSGATASAAARRPVRVVRRVTRRIVIVHPATPKPSITYVAAPSGSSSSSSSSSSAPASNPPASSTGGS